MKVIRNISRIIVGLVFIFSGFVKGVDPLGTAYRIEDYFIAYGMDFFMPLAIFLSISLCALEFILGIAALLNLRLKILSWPLMVLMAFFTLLTLYDAIYEPVPDCGCFGDAIKLSNWETFYKNIVLIVLVFVIFIERANYKSVMSGFFQVIIIGVFMVGFTYFMVHSYNHLPPMDFREWKVGKNMAPKQNGKSKVYLTYRNMASGETKEFLSPNYPWNDSVWMSKWEFVDQRIDDSEVIRAHGLKIEDFEGNDFTPDIIENSGYQFIVAVWSLENTDKHSFESLHRLNDAAYMQGHSFVYLTSAMPEDVARFNEEMDYEHEMYLADDIELKAMIRANPGLLLLRNGVILNKFHYNDIPEFSDLKEIYPDL